MTTCFVLIIKQLILYGECKDSLLTDKLAGVERVDKKNVTKLVPQW